MPAVREVRRGLPPNLDRSEVADRGTAEDELARLQVAANHRQAVGDLTPDVAGEVREHVEAGTISLARGVAVPAYEVQVLRQLNDQHGPQLTGPERLAAAEHLFQRAQVRVGVESLRHRGNPDAPELVAARSRRLAARRLLQKAAHAHESSQVGSPTVVQSSGPTTDGAVEATSPERCSGCGQFVGPGHVCAVPDGLPDADYAGLRGPDRSKAMLDDLQTAVQAVVESGQLTRWLDAMASNGLNRWSMNNRLLAVMQMVQRGEPLEGLHLMGFRQWEGQNRQVRKGEKAVWILAPVKRRIREEDEAGETSDRVIVSGFKPVPVFNVSQTQGEPLPESPMRPPAGEVTPGTLEGLRSRVGEAGYSYEEKRIPGCDPESGRGTLGYTDPATKEIVVDARLSPAQKASTIAHELGHVHCGHVDGDYEDYRQHRGRMETEAEMTAYMVNRGRGMGKDSAEAFAPGYIASWSKGDPAVMAGAMSTATKAFNTIMDGPWPAGQN
ncbi:MAG: ImmA/IrrE family metallo-endopeptidase [Humibacillus sp.]|nr:ImmA/IrrE family metallo-endopeptidase [Humibacillus sp.]